MAYEPGANMLAATEAASKDAQDARATAAYQALSNAYGPQVGNLNWLQAAQAQTAADQEPYAGPQAAADVAKTKADTSLLGAQTTDTGARTALTQSQTTGQNTENQFNALADPLKLTGLDLGNQQSKATIQETGARTGLIGAQTAATNTETAKSRFELGTEQAAQDRQTAMGILASLSDTASAGGDVGSKFDQLAPLIAKYEGVDPSHLPPLRAQLVQDPVGTINKLSSAIQAANLAATGGAGKGTSAALQMMKFGQQQMSLKDGLNFTQQRTAAVPDLTDQMQGFVGQMSTVATVRKAKSMIPGTPEYKFNQLVDRLKPSLSLDDIRTLKASGTSLGRVTNQEMGMAANALANLDLGQDLGTLRANLARVKNTYSVVNSNLAADIKRIGTGPGAGAMATQPSYMQGQVYVDRNGAKATWDGTKFVPMQ